MKHSEHEPIYKGGAKSRGESAVCVSCAGRYNSRHMQIESALCLKLYGILPNPHFGGIDTISCKERRVIDRCQFACTTGSHATTFSQGGLD